MEKQSKEVREKILSLEEQEKVLAAQKKAAERELAAWKAAQATAGESTSPGAYPTVTSGDFMRPAVGPVTSEFGSRWGTTHYGIDIGSGGQLGKPIVASAEGLSSVLIFPLRMEMLYLFRIIFVVAFIQRYMHICKAEVYQRDSVFLRDNILERWVQLVTQLACIYTLKSMKVYGTIANQRGKSEEICQFLGCIYSILTA